ncbi:GGDEF domain-containing protein, partial [Aciditerrimonas ferrireducens]
MDQGGWLREAVVAAASGGNDEAARAAGRDLGARCGDPEALLGQCRALRRARPAALAEARWQAAVDQLLAGALEAFLAPIEALADEDPLTGVGNRRAFERAVAVAVADAARTSRTLGLLLVDLDGLKVVNDRLGHAAGDEALRRLAKALRAASRAGDAVFRVGGDEFAVLLDGAGPRAAEAVAARAQDLGAPAFSWGAARSEPDGTVAGPDGTRQVFEAADQDLYRRRALTRARRLRVEAPGGAGLAGLGPLLTETLGGSLPSWPGPRPWRRSAGRRVASGRGPGVRGRRGPEGTRRRSGVVALLVLLAGLVLAVGVPPVLRHPPGRALGVRASRGTTGPLPASSPSGNRLP